MFLAGADGLVRDTTAVYHAARLLTHAWTDSAGGAHVLVPARADLRDSSGAAVVTSYALRRPDGAWSVLLVHKDSLHTARVTLRLAADTAGALGTAPAGVAEVTQLSAEQYAWAPNGAAGRPARSRPPVRRTQPASDAIELAGYSITVVVIRPS
jgi:hypothetical protein